MDSKYILDNFELEFSKTDERLLIQAKDKSTGTLISKAITHDSARALSQEHMLDPDMVYELLIDFFNNKQNKAALTLRNDGILTYACQVMYGRISKVLSFTIYLEKEDQNQENRLEKLVIKLSERVNELEKKLREKSQGSISKEDFEKISKANDRFLALEKFVMQKFEKIDDLERIVLKNEERLKALEEKVIGHNNEEKSKVQSQKNSIIDWQFSNASFGSKYTFLNHNKTVIAKGPEFYVAFAKQALPKGQQTVFTVLLEGPMDVLNYVAVGIASETSLGKNSCLDDKRTFFLTHGGDLFREGSSLSGYLGYTKGDKVSFSVDMSTGLAKVSVNGIPVGDHTFSKNDRTSYAFYPCVVTGNNKGVGATFI